MTSNEIPGISSRSICALLEVEPTHEASGVGRVSSNFIVDLDQSLLDNSSNLASSQSVLQPVAEEDGKWERFTELVGTGGRTGSLSNIQ